ncbi:MAG: hypothetical protein ACUVRX_11090 [Actinomycetota bacterium]
MRTKRWRRSTSAGSSTIAKTLHDHREEIKEVKVNKRRFKRDRKKTQTPFNSYGRWTPCGESGR